MIRAFFLSFSLRNTYRVNSFIYSLQQIPLLRKVLSNQLYKSRVLKVLGNIFSILWEIVSVFLGKFLYLWLMIYALLSLYKTTSSETFLHIFFFLTLIGAVMNTYMFNPTKDKYYAMVLMQMDARLYTLSNYVYAMLKTLVGFYPFVFLFGYFLQIPFWLSFFLPWGVCSAKILMSFYNLEKYWKKKIVINENNPPKTYWVAVLVFLLCAYGLPLLGIVLPWYIVSILFGLCIFLSIFAWIKVWHFKSYDKIYKSLLVSSTVYFNTTEVQKEMVRENSLKNIELDTNFVSHKNGYAYFHDLFVKRHQKILTLAVKKQAFVLVILFIGIVILLLFNQDIHSEINSLFLTYLPYFVFIMYLLNRGQTVTQAMFINCDHSMLTYRFYRTPKVILGLFRERLKTLILVNLLPALIIAIALPVLLFISGGTDNPLNYLVLFVSILAMSIFFSVHYLVLYYLLQPYNIQTEVKSGTYKIVQWLTYFVCYYMIQIQLPTISFGITVSIFCVLYSLISLFLAYKYAPKTFKLRL